MPDTKSAEILTYPNPTSEYVKVKGDFEFADLIISDAGGVEIARYESLTPYEEVDVLSLRPGIYMTTIITEKSITTKPLVIAR